jgi:hypothetical protein
MLFTEQSLNSTQIINMQASIEDTTQTDRGQHSETSSTSSKRRRN